MTLRNIFMTFTQPINMEFEEWEPLQLFLFKKLNNYKIKICFSWQIVKFVHIAIEYF